CGVWIVWDLDEDIRMGMLSAKLLRPIDPAHNYFAMSLTDKPVEMVFIFPPILLAMWWFGAEYSLSPVNFLLVFIGIFGAICIEFFVSMTIGALGFWITQMLSIIQVWFYLRAFFSGWLIPLSLFPESLQGFLLFAPFRYTLSFPVEILMGQINTNEILLGFTVQWMWVLLFFTSYRILWNKGISQFSAVGA
ncbi:MAG: ABC-2 family transporter protein, partial [Chloroflexota bacterium]